MYPISATKMNFSPGFSQVIPVDESLSGRPMLTAERARQLCAQLEAGHILFLRVSPVAIPPENRELLLGWKERGSRYHKNIAYRPSDNRLAGLAGHERKEADRLRRILREFSKNATEFLSGFLTPYAEKWQIEYASFRPLEERGRLGRLHARNDLLHFDSFPTRATNGARILRFFVNLNPAQSRVWMTSQTFEALGPRYAQAGNLLASVCRSRIARGRQWAARALRLPFLSRRPPYDEFMHRCHNAMKEDAFFQEGAPKHRWEFAPNSAWMVFTDCVSHAVLSGQYALEQTFLIPQVALVEPQKSPLALLQKIAGRPLTL